MSQYKTIEKAIHFIRRNEENNPSLEDIANFVDLSPSHFQRIFTEWAGISPKKFLQSIHLHRAKQMLNSKSMTLLDASVDLGLSGTGRLHDLFIKWEGMTPGEFKNGGKNLQISYTIKPTHFGDTLFASTEKGICSIQFTENPAQTLNELKSQFPNAIINEGSNSNQNHVIEFLCNPNLTIPEIKLHMKGTGFQFKVWEALLKIPAGNISTYGRLAESIGMPTSSRAVGSAIGKNPIAYLIPCHRVIQSSGSIGDYHWNSDRKAAILSWEALHSS
jgi:AraC family transcriptional regulator, regulatory protein of adaptative response / methylated-DNA-[protein]-cysteine methyltransferase